MGPPATKVFIGNLPDDCDRERLRELFDGVGPVAEFDIIKNYGFVHFRSESDAKKAVEELNETDFDGNSIKVEQSHSQVRHKPGMGTMTECYRCGKSGHWSKDCPQMGGGRGRGGRGRGRGGPRPYGRDPYPDPYEDPYYRRRYLPPAPYDRYSPYEEAYERRRLAMERDPYFLERERDYYEQLAARDAAYYDYYARRRAAAYADEGPGRAAGREPYAPPPRAGYGPPAREGYAPPRPDPARSRVPGPY